MAAKVFISYAGRDPQWPKEVVRALGLELEKLGTTVLLDQLHLEQQIEPGKLSIAEWREWMRAAVRDADRVICLVSARYAEAVERDLAEDWGFGVAYESLKLIGRLYQTKGRNGKWILTLRPDGAPFAHIPEDLRESCPDYQWPSERVALLEHAAIRRLPQSEAEAASAVAAGMMSQSCESPGTDRAEGQAAQALRHAMDVLGKFSKEAAEKAGKLLARSLTRHTVATAVGAAPAATGVGAPAVPITVTIANAVGLVLDVADGIWTGLQLAAQAPALISQVNGVFDAFKNFGGAAGELFKRYGLDPKQASWKDLLDKMKGMSTAEMVSDTMGLISRTNPCTRARRCMLVEYEETEDPKSLQGKGCCPGQTGHHLIPDKMMQGVDCPGYDYKKAPNICVEGVNQYHGSHNQIHKRLDGLVQMTPGQTIPMPTAMVVAAASVLAAFPESGCNPDCIIEQLKSHYKCQNANLNKTTGYNANEKGDARRSSGKR